MYVSVIYGFVYVFFQLIYIFGFDGKDVDCNDYIYSILNWKADPGTAVGWVVLVQIMFFIAQGLLCALMLARDLVWRKCLDGSSIENGGMDNLAFGSNHNYGSTE